MAAPEIMMKVVMSWMDLRKGSLASGSVMRADSTTVCPAAMGAMLASCPKSG